MLEGSGGAGKSKKGNKLFKKTKLYIERSKVLIPFGYTNTVECRVNINLSKLSGAG